MTIESPETKGRPQRWLYPLLMVSLAANLLIVGAVAGGLWRFRHHGFMGMAAQHGLMGFVRQLPSDRQAAVGKDLGLEKEKLRPIRQEMREAWSATNAAIGAEPFDKDKLKASAAKSAEANARMQAAIANTIVELADKLTPNERKLLQAWHDKQKQRMFGRRRGYDEPGDAGAEQGKVGQ
jgi:uncharacterized membrane protein